jgi:hypothetical protein
MSPCGIPFNLSTRGSCSRRSAPRAEILGNTKVAMVAADPAEANRPVTNTYQHERNGRSHDQDEFVSRHVKTILVISVTFRIGDT